MRPGRQLRLDRYSGEKLDWIVLTAVAYMCEGMNSYTHVFSNDYTAILRENVPEHVIDCARKWRRDFKCKAMPKNELQ